MRPEALATGFCVVLRNTVPSAEGQKQLDTLRQAVGKTLEKKRPLGQYAVTWQNGKSVVTGDDASRTDDNKTEVDAMSDDNRIAQGG